MAVLTHRFWTSSFNGDPTVIGKTIRLGPRTVTIVGVLEPSVPYPVDTELIANMVASPHHLGATMNTDRTHRMTELFGRLAPGASVEGARAELTAAHAAIVRERPEAYPAKTNVQLSITPFRDPLCLRLSSLHRAPNRALIDARRQNRPAGGTPRGESALRPRVGGLPR